MRRKVQELDRVALGEATPPVRDLGQRGRAAGALDRARRRGAAASGAGARLPRRRARRLHPLRQPARSRQAGRPADRGGRARAVAPRRRRRRRPGRRPAAAARARDRGVDGRVRFAGRVDATSSPTSTPPASPRTTRRSTRTSGSGRTSRSSPVSRSITATDAGGPLDVVHDGATGRVVAPEAAAVGVGGGLAPRPSGRGRAFGRAGKAIAAEVTWDTRDRRGCSREGRDLQPDAARAVRDRRLLRAPAARAAGALRGRRRQAGSEEAAARHRPLCLPHRQQPGCARLDRRGAAPDARASSSSTTSSSTTSSPASRSAVATATATSTRWSARAASSGGCSATPCSTSGSRRCGRTGPRTSISPARCSVSRPG